MNSSIEVTREIQQALAAKQAVVALESAVITHGLPAPHNLETALAMEQDVRENGAIPATIAILAGRVKAGLSAGEIEMIAAQDSKAVKISNRTLYIKTSSPAWAQELSFLKSEIIIKFNQQAGEEAINDIRFSASGGSAFGGKSGG